MVGWGDGGGGFHSIIWSHQLCVGLKLGCDNILNMKISREMWEKHYLVSSKVTISVINDIQHRQPTQSAALVTLFRK